LFADLANEFKVLLEKYVLTLYILLEN